MTHTFADYLPPVPQVDNAGERSRWLELWLGHKVDVNFRDSIDDLGLALNNFDVFRDVGDGISVQSPFNCC